MDIGIKLKNARINSGMTQEEIAEALDVSRQTISNWENEKSYPDIINVIRMSDLYAISLDCLLKDAPAPDAVSTASSSEAPIPKENGYLSYLKESTNVVKSKNLLGKIIVIAIYLVIWSISLLEYWVFMSPDDAMGYALLFLWILLPLLTLVVSAIIGAANYWGKWKWFSIPILGLMYLLACYGTFGIGNALSTSSFATPVSNWILPGLIASALGLAIGSLIHKIRINHKSK